MFNDFWIAELIINDLENKVEPFGEGLLGLTRAQKSFNLDRFTGIITLIRTVECLLAGSH